MLRIAVSSDNHLDVNRIAPSVVMREQVAWLRRHQIDYYLFAGDLFNDFQKTSHYFQQMQAMATSTKVFFIAGNHDMLSGVDWSTMENFASPQYLHRKFVDLPGTDWHIIGNNGWYDYSFSQYVTEPEQVRRWKNVYWLDSVIDQPMDDQQRMQLVLKQVRQQLRAAQDAQKKVLFLTHFVPLAELADDATGPTAPTNPRYQRVYQMFRAMLGSNQLGSLLEQFANVKMVFYGHLHGAHPPVIHSGVTYYHQAVGVKNKRTNEWQAPTLLEQWKKTCRIIQLDDDEPLDQ
ncbi:metallophosphoesterase [Limosilactobacillus caecicola]|uniref:metallophosphoesterase n=1 Tax=Limosilactobacillus caecicola TaxID=2941332 RepID=UPI00203DA558|nr:metallophosphoesterase [Limosilactobacillus caecicola]